MPNIDPRQMEKMMRQMGITTTNISAKLVVIETDHERILIKNPQVTEVTMAGQKSYQIAGEVTKEAAISEDDVKMVMEQTGATQQDASDALKKTNGDIAEAILLLKK